MKPHRDNTWFPYGDGYIVPRYRYRPEDDRVDRCGGPVVPVIRIGSRAKPFPFGSRILWASGVFLVEIGPAAGKAASRHHAPFRNLDSNRLIGAEACELSAHL